jgi:hypothetical protein
LSLLSLARFEIGAADAIYFNCWMSSWLGIAKGRARWIAIVDVFVGDVAANCELREDERWIDISKKTIVTL